VMEVESFSNWALKPLYLLLMFFLLKMKKSDQN
jgi:hypothetical protein